MNLLPSLVWHLYVSWQTSHRLFDIAQSVFEGRELRILSSELGASDVTYASQTKSVQMKNFLLTTAMGATLATAP